MLRKVVLLATVIVGDLALPLSLLGQVLRGKVAVVDIADPIPDAVVVLTSPDGTVHSAILTDSAERFEVAAPGPGEYVVRVHAAGFASVGSDPIRIDAGSVVEVRINMRRSAILLEGITIFGTARYAGFHDRRALEEEFSPYRYGWFDQERIERWYAHRVSDVLARVPLFQDRCTNLWIDGEYVAPSDWRYEWMLGGSGAAFPIDWVYGVEVFRTKGDTPDDFKRWGDSNCGVVVVWTRPIGGDKR